ncbi:MAG: hypothetical protein J6W29_02455 [Neisseriaceae bacterium]|nr:hypothetical protein [Neisseriaceae bacterium]
MSNEQWILCQALSGLTNILLDNASIYLSGCLKRSGANEVKLKYYRSVI